MRKPIIAALMITGSAALWGLSFPVTKALAIEERILFQSVGSLGSSSAILFIRYGMAAILTFLLRGNVRSFTRRELTHGAVLGAAIGVGSIFQVDGLNFTSASVSAFLTSFYAVLVPVAQTIRSRRPPSVRLVVSCVLVMAGIGMLSGIRFSELLPGRGELETLLAAAFFSIQIIWMANVDPSRDNALHVTAVMCAIVALVQVVPLLFERIGPVSLWSMHDSVRSWLLLLTLAVPSTLLAFVLMNRYQPFVSPAAASIIYCTEPIFTVIFAAVIPGYLVRSPAMYPDEKLTMGIVTGGILITAANVIIALGNGGNKAGNAGINRERGQPGMTSSP